MPKTGTSEQTKTHYDLFHGQKNLKDRKLTTVYDREIALKMFQGFESGGQHVDVFEVTVYTCTTVKKVTR